MKLVLISNTHSLHRNLVLPKGDIIIHAGDITDCGTKEEVVDFLDWFSALDYQNHSCKLQDVPFRKTASINASNLDSYRGLINPPIMIEL